MIHKSCQPSTQTAWCRDTAACLNAQAGTDAQTSNLTVPRQAGCLIVRSHTQTPRGHDTIACVRAKTGSSYSNKQSHHSKTGRLLALEGSYTTVPKYWGMSLALAISGCLAVLPELSVACRNAKHFERTGKQGNMMLSRRLMLGTTFCHKGFQADV